VLNLDVTRTGCVCLYDVVVVRALLISLTLAPGLSALDVHEGSACGDDGNRPTQPGLESDHLFSGTGCEFYLRWYAGCSSEALLRILTQQGRNSTLTKSSAPPDT